MFDQVMSAALVGIEALPVRVEADVSDGLPGFSMVGSLGPQVKEAGDRVRTALRNVGLALPPRRITINISPADVRKEGTRFDLPIALAILLSEAALPKTALEGVMVLGELSLDGRINGVPGVLASVMAARDAGCRLCLVPADNAVEAAIVTEIPSAGVATLKEAVALLKGESAPAPLPQPALPSEMGPLADMSDIRGQDSVKQAAVLAAAGFHNLMMCGPPGSGKSMLARRLVTILPTLSREERLEITKIYSAAGLLAPDHPVITDRPFRSPHHTASDRAMTGGGAVPRPGEITLAHRGVLFLDEMPEFSRNALEVLRQPLEDREITISRVAGTYHYPASFLLLGAMNPCPCGYYPDRQRCSCRPEMVRRYEERISRPLLDRFDLFVYTQAVGYEDLMKTGREGTTSAQLRARVEKARQIQERRFAGSPIFFNAEIPASRLEEFCPLTEGASALLERAFHRMGLTGRAVHRILRVARTAADLEEEAVIGKSHMEDALFYRLKEAGER
ncbi:MAG: YifB family Mg chelatase-like AAA ATPase [Lachnospiraceae bacterium]|nr:YifB family Mg chelatase-like AAA ATPase [Lachnospiraceae bacterium]